jgi:hypothetical protein
MAKTIRYARTSVNGGLGNMQPTAQERVVPHETYKAPGITGLEGLGAAMSTFFGLTQTALGTLQDGINIGERERIKQENAAQKAQAANDFYAGKDMDPSQTGDLDYYDTYRSLLAVKTGDQASKDFQDYYLKTWAPDNPTGDLSAARDAWVKDNLAGSQDSDFTAQTLAQFYHSTDGMVAGQKENAVKNQIAQGKQTLSEAIGADVRSGTFTPDRIPFYIQSYKTLDPLNPYEAAPYVAGELGTAARNNPDKGMSVINALSKAGTGVNGKSFAESFPDAFAALNSKVVEDWTSVKTMDQWNVIDGLRQRAMKFKEMSDGDLQTWLQDLTVASSKYGSPPVMDSMRGALATEMERRAVTGAGVEQTRQMLYQDLPKDESTLKKFLPDFFKEKFGIDNILKGDPKVVADVLVRAGGAVPDDYKVQISSALTSFENPKAQAAAAQLLLNVQNARDLKFADGLVNDDASRYLHHIAAEQNATDEPLDASITRANEIRRNRKALEWSDVVKVSSGEKVADKVNSAIDDSVAKAAKATSWIPFWGTSVTIPPDVRQTISDYALNVVEDRGNQGVDWQTAVDEAVSRMSSRGEIRPGNGNYMFTLNTDVPTQWEATDGKMHTRPRLGFAEFNRTTGQPVNTVQVYESQLGALGKVHGALLPNGNISGVSLSDASPYASSVGAYSVLQDGRPVNYLPGEPIHVKVPTTVKFETINGDFAEAPSFTDGIIKFPADPRNDPALADLPEGFGFVPMPLANGQTSWLLAYRPNFGDQAGKTLDQRAREWKQPVSGDATRAISSPDRVLDPLGGPSIGIGGVNATDPLSQPPNVTSEPVKPTDVAPVSSYQPAVMDMSTRTVAPNTDPLTGITQPTGVDPLTGISLAPVAPAKSEPVKPVTKAPVTKTATTPAIEPPAPGVPEVPLIQQMDRRAKLEKSKDATAPKPRKTASDEEIRQTVYDNIVKQIKRQKLSPEAERNAIELVQKNHGIDPVTNKIFKKLPTAVLGVRG